VTTTTAIPSVSLAVETGTPSFFLQVIQPQPHDPSNNKYGFYLAPVNVYDPQSPTSHDLYFTDNDPSAFILTPDGILQDSTGVFSMYLNKGKYQNAVQMGAPAYDSNDGFNVVPKCSEQNGLLVCQYNTLNTFWRCDGDLQLFIGNGDQQSYCDPLTLAIVYPSLS
jgi:hypothetical protein